MRRRGVHQDAAPLRARPERTVDVGNVVQHPGRDGNVGRLESSNGSSRYVAEHERRHLVHASSSTMRSDWSTATTFAPELAFHPLGELALATTDLEHPPRGYSRHGV